MSPRSGAEPVLPLWNRIHARCTGLPRPRPWRMRTLRIPMRDGIRLGADLYTPVAPSKGVLLVVGPYGRGFLFSLSLARAFAGQGYTVVFASTRGTADSEGEFDPMRSDASDGRDIVAWMREQPWYPGCFGAIGSSYMGYTQWALMSDPPDDLAAAVVTMGPHDFADHCWGTDSFRYDLISWGIDVGLPETGNFLRDFRASAARRKYVDTIVRAEPVLSAARSYFPAAGQHWMLDRLMCDDLDDPIWTPMRHADALENSTVPTLIIAGWQDIFLSQSIRQYERLAERGVDVALTVGAWTHMDILVRAQPVIESEALDWLDARLAGTEQPRRRTPVRVQLGGSRKSWVDLHEWPPTAVTSKTLYLGPGGVLDENPPGPDAVENSFVFDPARPTPTIGGNLFKKGGYRDDTAYAARGDVLVYDSAPLAEDVRLMGAPTVRLEHASERKDADLFVRVSDVDGKGRSRNVTETYRRVSGAGTVVLELNDTAYVFAAGHRVRLIIAGGSFPQYSRNPGTGENPLAAETLHPNRHEIHHADGASTVRLLVAPTAPKEGVS